MCVWVEGWLSVVRAAVLSLAFCTLVCFTSDFAGFLRLFSVRNAGMSACVMMKIPIRRSTRSIRDDGGFRTEKGQWNILDAFLHSNYSTRGILARVLTGS